MRAVHGARIQDAEVAQALFELGRERAVGIRHALHRGVRDGFELAAVLHDVGDHGFGGHAVLEGVLRPVNGDLVAVLQVDLVHVERGERPVVGAVVGTEVERAFQTVRTEDARQAHVGVQGVVVAERERAVAPFGKQGIDHHGVAASCPA